MTVAEKINECRADPVFLRIQARLLEIRKEEAELFKELDEKFRLDDLGWRPGFRWMLYGSGLCPSNLDD